MKQLNVSRVFKKCIPSIVDATGGFSFPGGKNEAMFFGVTVSSFDIIRLIMKGVHKFKTLERTLSPAGVKSPGVGVKILLKLQAA